MIMLLVGVVIGMLLEHFVIHGLIDKIKAKIRDLVK